MAASSSCPSHSQARELIPVSNRRPYKSCFINFHGARVRIFLQDERHGPCPLLALCNILSLQGRLHVKVTTTELTGEQLSKKLCSLLEDELSTRLQDAADKNMEDSFACCETAAEEIPKLERGVNVNLGFSGCSDFALGLVELAPFRAFGIDLRHGWLPDPMEQRPLVEAIGNRSYDELSVEIATAGPEQCPALRLCQDFLEGTVGQMTEYGLVSIYKSMDDGGLAALYRNNHISVIHKHQDMLYTLVSDEAVFAARGGGRTWMTLSNVFGDESFVDDRFGEKGAIKPEKDCCDDCVIF